MTRTEAQQQLAQIRLDVISSKNQLKTIIEAPVLENFFSKEKDNAGTLIQTISSVIDQITAIEKQFPGYFFFR